MCPIIFTIANVNSAESALLITLSERSDGIVISVSGSVSIEGALPRNNTSNSSAITISTSSDLILVGSTLPDMVSQPLNSYQVVSLSATSVEDLLSASFNRSVFGETGLSGSYGFRGNGGPFDTMFLPGNYVPNTIITDQGFLPNVTFSTFNFVAGRESSLVFEAAPGETDSITIRTLAVPEPSAGILLLLSIFGFAKQRNRIA